MLATTVRIGFHLGNGDVPAAKYIMRVSALSSLIIGALVAAAY